MNGEPQIKVFYDYQNRDVNDKHYYKHNKITLWTSYGKSKIIRSILNLLFTTLLTPSAIQRKLLVLLK